MCIQNVSHPHALNMWTSCRCTRGRFECTRKRVCRTTHTTEMGDRDENIYVITLTLRPMSKNPKLEQIEQHCGNLKGCMALWAPATVLSLSNITPQSSRVNLSALLAPLLRARDSPCRRNRCAREVQEVQVHTLSRWHVHLESGIELKAQRQ